MSIAAPMRSRRRSDTATRRASARRRSSPTDIARAANSLVQNARAAEGFPQERDYLSRAAEAYRQALGEYAKVSGFANVPQSIARTQRALLQVEETPRRAGFTALPERRRQ